jgi:hypothetical protein
MFTWREKIADSSALPEESRKQLKTEIETIIASHQKDFQAATDAKDMKKAIETAVKMKYFYKVSAKIIVFFHCWLHSYNSIFSSQMIEELDELIG